MGKAKKIESIINSRSVHVVYSVSGKFYNPLKNFPATLFDMNGYIVFKTKSDCLKNEHLKHGERLNIPEGISHISGYRPYSADEKKLVLGFL